MSPFCMGVDMDGLALGTLESSVHASFRGLKGMVFTRIGLRKQAVARHIDKIDNAIFPDALQRAWWAKLFRPGLSDRVQHLTCLFILIHNPIRS